MTKTTAMSLSASLLALAHADVFITTNSQHPRTHHHLRTPIFNQNLSLQDKCHNDILTHCPAPPPPPLMLRSSLKNDPMIKLLTGPPPHNAQDSMDTIQSLFMVNGIENGDDGAIENLVDGMLDSAVKFALVAPPPSMKEKKEEVGDVAEEILGSMMSSFFGHLEEASSSSSSSSSSRDDGEVEEEQEEEGAIDYGGDFAGVSADRADEIDGGVRPEEEEVSTNQEEQQQQREEEEEDSEYFEGKQPNDDDEEVTNQSSYDEEEEEQEEVEELPMVGGWTPSFLSKKISDYSRDILRDEEEEAEETLAQSGDLGTTHRRRRLTLEEDDKDDEAQVVRLRLARRLSEAGSIPSLLRPKLVFGCWTDKCMWRVFDDTPHMLSSECRDALHDIEAASLLPPPPPRRVNEFSAGGVAPIPVTTTTSTTVWSAVVTPEETEPCPVFFLVSFFIFFILLTALFRRFRHRRFHKRHVMKRKILRTVMDNPAIKSMVEAEVGESISDLHHGCPYHQEQQQQQDPKEECMIARALDKACGLLPVLSLAMLLLITAFTIPDMVVVIALPTLMLTGVYALLRGCCRLFCCSNGDGVAAYPGRRRQVMMMTDEDGATNYVAMEDVKDCSKCCSAGECQGCCGANCSCCSNGLSSLDGTCCDGKCCDGKCCDGKCCGNKDMTGDNSGKCCDGTCCCGANCCNGKCCGNNVVGDNIGNCCDGKCCDGKCCCTNKSTQNHTSEGRCGKNCCEEKCARDGNCGEECCGVECCKNDKSSAFVAVPIRVV